MLQEKRGREEREGREGEGNRGLCGVLRVYLRQVRSSALFALLASDAGGYAESIILFLSSLIIPHITPSKS